MAVHLLVEGLPEVAMVVTGTCAIK